MIDGKKKTWMEEVTNADSLLGLIEIQSYKLQVEIFISVSEKKNYKSNSIVTTF